MMFGKVADPSIIDFSLPDDHSSSLSRNSSAESQAIKLNMGLPTWNKQKLEDFYPRGTKNDLSYYSSKYNSIELNATYYKIYSAEQIAKWKENASPNFTFCPKVPQIISQYKKLKNCEQEVDLFVSGILAFEEKLGMTFLQMNPNYSPNNEAQLVQFLNKWPRKIPLAVELRHHDWYEDRLLLADLIDVFKELGISFVITDTAGRRDMIHMCLTTPRAFVRFTGVNDVQDIGRVDDWMKRIKDWSEQGITEINFFIHQNHEKETPLLPSYFAKKMSHQYGFHIDDPLRPDQGQTLSLF